MKSTKDFILPANDGNVGESTDQRSTTLARPAFKLQKPGILPTMMPFERRRRVCLPGATCPPQLELAPDRRGFSHGTRAGRIPARAYRIGPRPLLRLAVVAGRCSPNEVGDYALDTHRERSFGEIARIGLSRDFLLSDLTVVYALTTRVNVDPGVDLIHIPEPSALVLALMAAIGFGVFVRRRVTS